MTVMTTMIGEFFSLNYHVHRCSFETAKRELEKKCGKTDLHGSCIQERVRHFKGVAVCFTHDRYIKFNISLKFQSHHFSSSHSFQTTFKWYHKLRYIMQRKASSITAHIRLYTFTSHTCFFVFYSLTFLCSSALSLSSFLRFTSTYVAHCVHSIKEEKAVGCSSTQEYERMHA